MLQPPPQTIFPPPQRRKLPLIASFPPPPSPIPSPLFFQDPFRPDLVRFGAARCKKSVGGGKIERRHQEAISRPFPLSLFSKIPLWASLKEGGGMPEGGGDIESENRLSSHTPFPPPSPQSSQPSKEVRAPPPPPPEIESHAAASLRSLRSKGGGGGMGKRLRACYLKRREGGRRGRTFAKQTCF